jgi:uncharacterized protein
VTDPALAGLLRVQEHDLAVQQLTHRRATLSQRAALAEAEATASALAAELDELVGRAADLARTQRRLEGETATVEAKIAETDRTLYSGAVTAPRELEALQAEIASLRRRTSTLEDETLEVMEQAEPVEAGRSDVEARLAATRVEIDRLRDALAESVASIDAELASERESRAAAAAEVPADLLASYESLRDDLGGIGVARLVDGRCSGCHLALPATELAALRRTGSGTIVHHEECGRILVPAVAEA